MTGLARLRTLTVPAVAALAVIVSGCATGASEESPSTASTTTAAAPVEQASEAEPAPTSEPPEAAEPTLVQLAMGDTFTTERGNTMTVHEVRTNIPFEYESEDGGAWHAIDTEYCLGDTLPELVNFQEFAYGWVLRTEEGYVLDFPGSSYDGIVSPMLDLYSVTPAAGECYRGWVLIDGPADVSVTSARFYELDWSVS